MEKFAAICIKLTYATIDDEKYLFVFSLNQKSQKVNDTDSLVFLFDNKTKKSRKLNLLEMNSHRLVC